MDGWAAEMRLKDKGIRIKRTESRGAELRIQLESPEISRAARTGG